MILSLGSVLAGKDDSITEPRSLSDRVQVAESLLQNEPVVLALSKCKLLFAEPGR
jgi:hypothetical protein